MKFASFSLAAVAVILSTTYATAENRRSRSQDSSPSTPTAYINTTTVPSTPVTVQSYPTIPSWQPGAATADESWAYGRAAVINALGMADLNSAMAANYWQSARAMANDNWNREVRTNWQIRDDYKARVAAEHPVLTPTQHREITKVRDPKRLSAAELTANGAIRWPAALQGEEFADLRAKLDDLFAERAREFASGNAELARQVDAVAIEMTKALEGTDSDIALMDRVSAKNFLGGLRVEARVNAVGIDGQVASR
jgi:hypothetical protein